MKNVGLTTLFIWLLGLVCSLELRAQYVVNECQQLNEITVITESEMRVSPTGTFINRSTVYYRGVATLINEGGFSEEGTNCVALYASPCTQSAGSSGLNIFEAGQSLTTISGSSPVRMYAVDLSRDIALENEWQIVSGFNWQAGIVTTDKGQPTRRLHWLGGSVTGAAAGRHVNGYAAWSGSGYFSLPVGDGTKLQPAGVVGDCGTVFSAAYFSGDPGSASMPTGAPFSTSSTAAGVGTVSQAEYWDVNGADSTAITLHFDASSNLSALAGSLSEIIIVGWNGSQWVSLGNTASTGSLSGSGTMTSRNVVPDDYTVFSFASGCETFVSGAIAATGETICYAGTPGQIGSTTAASGGDGTITYSWRSSADNYTAAISGATAATYTPPAGLTSTTTYRRYAQDGTCNTTATASTGDWTVTVRPAPGLVCPANISINTNNDGTGNCSGTASWTHPLEANGACSPISLHMSVDGGTAALVQAGSAQSLSLATGSHTVAYTLTDGGGNSSSCAFTVVVTDNEVPAIICNNRTVTFGGQANQSLTAADLATATDNCGISGLQTSLSMVNCNQVGQTLTATLLATDVNGLQSSCVSQVTVTGLECGWEAQEDGVNCEDGNIANYNPQTQTYTLTSVNCYTPVGSHLADGGAFLQRTLCGNSSITALVENLQGDLGWAGLIMRESNAPGAKKVSLTTDRNFNHRREVRSVANTLVSPQYWRGLNRYWLRLLRVNQQIVGYISTNGSNWQQVMVGSVQMNSCVEVGLWAFNSNPTGTMTATFRHITTTGNMVMNTLQEMPAGVAAEDMEQAMHFSVFPNPSAGDFFLDLSAYREQALRIRVTDMLGREVYKQTLDAVTEDIHTLTLPGAVQAGYYQLSLESDGQHTQTAKIMVIRK